MHFNLDLDDKKRRIFWKIKMMIVTFTSSEFITSSSDAMLYHSFKL